MPELPPDQQLRLQALMRLAPDAESVLEIGARDGRVTRLLSERYSSVLALDLQRPAFEFPHVTTAAGDVRSLQFLDRSFDLVLCTEVLEHVPELESATRELCRVARRHILVGVPHRQDLRHDRTTCAACGHRNPPYGHVHAFDEQRLFRLFPGWLPSTITHVGEVQDRTSGLAAWLMDLAGNPWGAYGAGERCLACGSELQAAPAYSRSLPRRIAAGIAVRLDRLQALLTQPRAGWLHVLFSSAADSPAAAMLASPGAVKA
ncbi:MAG: class I SAM-dependent methyltransferase [Bryobacteraceae bacterium]|jgi:SAM-dependent methyltransferase